MKGIAITYTVAAAAAATLVLTAAASSDSFSQLHYGSNPSSASSIIDALLQQSTTTDESVNDGNTADNTATSIISTVASLDTSIETDIISEGYYGDDNDYVYTDAASSTTIQSYNSANVCALSVNDARSKVCNSLHHPSNNEESTMTECKDAMDCVRGEACFLDVTCEVASSSSSGTSTTSSAAASTAMTTTSSGEDNNGDDFFDISHYVMLGKDMEGETMTLANGMFQTTSTAMATEEEPVSAEAMNSESFASLTMHSGSDSTYTSSQSSSQTIASQIETILTSIQSTIDNELFLSETPLSDWIPSTVYRFNGFYDGLKIMHSVGVAGKKLYIGSNSPTNDFLSTGQIIENNVDCEHCFMYGLVNVAAFLAQAMKETIRYDACDENSWDRVGSREMYPISNSCGQLGQSYQDYHCSDEEAHMECPVDPTMEITAVTHAKWWGAPGPLMCGPKSKYPVTGYWDYGFECNNPWANPPISCDVYEGQKAGKAVNDEPYPNAAGRTDVEGCCWWGRGVIQTSGVCNFGKLNYFLGKRAFTEGRDSRYPDIDFCRDPEVICRSEEHKELKWIAGFFYWVDSVQPYDVDGWNYLTELRRFVNDGMTGDAFINSVSGIVNRGCHNPPCGTGDLDGGPERADNFFKILKALESSFVDIATTAEPTPLPTPMPVAPLPTPMPIIGTASPISSAISYNCGDGSQSLESLIGSFADAPPSFDVTFDYEVHSDLDVAVSQALQEIKQSILSDVAANLGCTESTQRKLQGFSGNIVGFTSNRSDMPDPEAPGCMVDIGSLVPTACTPVQGGIKIFANQGTNEEDLSSMGEYLKDSIRDSMDSGRYETNNVKKVTWIGDRDVYMEAMTPQSSSQILSEPEPAHDWMMITIYSLAGVCSLLLCALCMILPTARRKRQQSRDEEALMIEYMNAQRENNQYNRHLTLGQPNPKLVIQRRSEHLRAVQQGTPHKSSYDVGNEATTSESEDDDSYFYRRPSINHKKGSLRHINHTSAKPPMTAGEAGHFYANNSSTRDMQEPPIHRRESSRQVNRAPVEPPMVIGEAGHFYVKSSPDHDVQGALIQRRESSRQMDNVPVEPPMIVGEAGHFYVKSSSSQDDVEGQGEYEESAEEYQHERSVVGVQSLHSSTNSSIEEEEHPFQPPRRRHTVQGAKYQSNRNLRTESSPHLEISREDEKLAPVHTTHEPNHNSDRQQRRDVMSKEERQRRIERARSKRMSHG